MKLAGIFRDRMILQRDKENHIWGWDEGSSVKVTIGDDVYEGSCSEGRFDIVIPPRKVQIDIDITVSGTEEDVLHNVCFGDVFMLAGQSNMELPVSRTLDNTKDIVDRADYPYIRQYRLVPDNDFKPLEDYRLPDQPWVSAVPGEIMEMSALGFFTFRKIYEKTNVPIGLILNAQGGSTIEAWMRREDLDEGLCSELSLIEQNYGAGFLPAKVAAQYEEGNKWREVTEKFDIDVYAKSIPEDAQDIQVPGIYKDLTGASWFYKEFTLTEDIDQESAFIYVGELVDADRTYINGVEVGRTEYLYPPRKYPFDAKVLRKGKNLVAVRLITEQNKGGFIPEHPYYVEAGDTRIDLRGTWKCVREVSCGINPPVKMMVMYPTVLYNSAIQTLRGLAVKAFFWYQGESNGEAYERYNEKFEMMISSWREIFGQDIPVVATVMPDYIDPLSEDLTKVPYGWRRIQQYQKDAALDVSGCYVVDGEDLGMPYELHPQRKDELGNRAAIVFSEVLGING